MGMPHDRIFAMAAGYADFFRNVTYAWVFVCAEPLQNSSGNRLRRTDALPVPHSLERVMRTAIPNFTFLLFFAELPRFVGVTQRPP